MGRRKTLPEGFSCRERYEAHLRREASLNATHKTCRTCGVPKPVGQFHPNGPPGPNRQKLKPDCKPCNTAANINRKRAKQGLPQTASAADWVERQPVADLTGQRFTHLVVVRRMEKDEQRTSKKKEIPWMCVCDCGKSSQAHGAALRSGKRTSCGCRSRKPMSPPKPPKVKKPPVSDAKRSKAYRARKKESSNQNDKLSKHKSPTTERK